MIPNNIHAQSCFHLEGSASSWKCKISLLNEMPYFLKKLLCDCRLTHRLANICNLVSFYPPNHFSIDVLHSFQGLAHPLLYVMPYSGETLCEAGLYQTVIGMGTISWPNCALSENARMKILSFLSIFELKHRSAAITSPKAFWK